MSSEAITRRLDEVSALNRLARYLGEFRAGEPASRWIDAATTLAADPRHEVVCPQCSDALLEVTDQPLDAATKLFERHLRCPSCGAYNSMRMHSR